MSYTASVLPKPHLFEFQFENLVNFLIKLFSKIVNKSSKRHNKSFLWFKSYGLLKFNFKSSQIVDRNFLWKTKLRTSKFGTYGFRFINRIYSEKHKKTFKLKKTLRSVIIPGKTNRKNKCQELE